MEINKLYMFVGISFWALNITCIQQKTSTESSSITLDLFQPTTFIGSVYVEEFYVMSHRGEVKKDINKLRNNILSHYFFFKKVLCHSYINKLLF